MSSELTSKERVEKALESIAKHYPDIDLGKIPIEFSDTIPNLGRYYRINPELRSLIKSSPSLGRYCDGGQRIVLSTETLTDPELSWEFNGFDTVEIVLHHEILHYLIDIYYIEPDSENVEVWIDETLKAYYLEKRKSWDPDETGLKPIEVKRLQKLIQRYNSDSDYRRKIMRKGNSMLAGRKAPKISDAEEYLAMMAWQTRY